MSKEESTKKKVRKKYEYIEGLDSYRLPITTKYNMLEIRARYKYLVERLLSKIKNTKGRKKLDKDYNDIIWLKSLGLKLPYNYYNAAVKDAKYFWLSNRRTRHFKVSYEPDVIYLRKPALSSFTEIPGGITVLRITDKLDESKKHNGRYSKGASHIYMRIKENDKEMIEKGYEIVGVVIHFDRGRYRRDIKDVYYKILFRREKQPLKKEGSKSVGLSIGYKKLFVTSEGEIYNVDISHLIDSIDKTGEKPLLDEIQKYLSHFAINNHKDIRVVTVYKYSFFRNKSPNKRLRRYARLIPWKKILKLIHKIFSLYNIPVIYSYRPYASLIHPITRRPVEKDKIVDGMDYRLRLAKNLQRDGIEAVTHTMNEETGKYYFNWNENDHDTLFVNKAYATTLNPLISDTLFFDSSYNSAPIYKDYDKNEYTYLYGPGLIKEDRKRRLGFGEDIKLLEERKDWDDKIYTAIVYELDKLPDKAFNIDPLRFFHIVNDTVKRIINSVKERTFTIEPFECKEVKIDSNTTLKGIPKVIHREYIERIEKKKKDKDTEVTHMSSEAKEEMEKDYFEHFLYRLDIIGIFDSSKRREAIKQFEENMGFKVDKYMYMEEERERRREEEKRRLSPETRELKDSVHSRIKEANFRN